ncbi:MAG: DUF4912 domain-containing protein [Pirellulaceae bacterium]|nr:DUF4912 domain-containing protein [Pirellulaceae bacterium]
MSSLTSLKAQTVKQLGTLAKKLDLTGWQNLRKDDLIQAILKEERRRKRQTAAAKKSSLKKKKGKVPPESYETNGHAKSRNSKTTSKSATHNTRKSHQEVIPQKSAARRLTSPPKNQPTRSQLTPIQSPSPSNNGQVSHLHHSPVLNSATAPQSPSDLSSTHFLHDKIDLTPCSSYWLRASWQISPEGTRRAKAALAEQWHSAQPVLRLIQIEGEANNIEYVRSLVAIHNGVDHWFLEAPTPHHSYRVEIGYLATNQKFHRLAHSDTVTPPAENTVLKNYDNPPTNKDLGKRKTSAALAIAKPILASRESQTNEEFPLTADLKATLHGRTIADGELTVDEAPVEVEVDGAFQIDLELPNRRQVLTLVAVNPTTLQEKTLIIAIERNTKSLEKTPLCQ